MVIFRGNDTYAYRDPACFLNDGTYYLFFTVSQKENGYMYNYVAMSRSNDLKIWGFLGNTNGGENACVIKKDDEFILVHSPNNGICFSKSKNLASWEEFGFTTLKQNEWEWASGRITAGFVMRCAPHFKYKYMMFFHGSKNVYPETHGNASLAVAFTNDFKNFYYDI